MFLRNNKNKKVLVAMSGGVDSSVSALLLKKSGYQVAGAFIRGYNVDGCQDKEGEDARLVAEQIGIPFYVFDFEKEYKEQVVDYLLDGYRKGLTPNPDVVCNSQIKFGLFYKRVMDLGFDYVASGHYARLCREISNNKFQITNWFKKRVVNVYQGKDRNKDQSYFLWQVEKEKFDKILFPIGDLKKKKVRKIAQKNNLLVADKKDSQGICFLGKFDFGDFLREEIKIKKGDIIDVNGKKVGEHDGVWLYTIGQKHGFINTAGREFYVIRKDLERNELIVAYEKDERLYCREFEISEINFLDEGIKGRFNFNKTINIFIRTRYRQKLEKATLLKIGENKARIELKKADKIFPASGQSAVFYKKNGQMLGGGVII